MQSAFRCYHGSIARGLRTGARSRTLPVSTPVLGIDGGLRHTHAVPECQNHAWSHGFSTKGLALTKKGVGGIRLFRHSMPASESHQLTAAKKKNEIRPYGSAVSQRGRSEKMDQEREKEERPVARTLDSPAQSSQRGRLLTTPSRSLKLLIPLPIDHPEDMETIAILVHSQQPLSYLETLIQTELSLIKDESGQQRHPAISFIVYQFEDHPIRPGKRQGGKTTRDVDQLHEMEVEEVAIPHDKGHGHPELRPSDEDVDTYSSLGKPQPNRDGEQLYVRWSHATEVGDFIRDAARAGEFIMAIEGAPSGLDQVKITVPSFDERTYYLRMRLRRISDRISKVAAIKNECDKLAHRGGQRVALAGFGVLASWWLLVYKLTFGTSLGWDTMEPITYLASLSTLMGGYLWFLYHNREISYRSALDITINARQKKLYQQRGVDLQLWEDLTYEGNALRREIQTISADYETQWDERLDERDEGVVEALKEQRNGRKDRDDSLDEKDKSND